MAITPWLHRYRDLLWELMVAGAAGVDPTGLAGNAYALLEPTMQCRSIRTEAKLGIQEIELFLTDAAGGN